MEEPGGRLGEAIRQWRTPLGVATGVALAVLVSLPLSGRTGPRMPGLSAAWCAVVLLCDLLSAALLVGLYRNGRGARMLVLATAFAWSAIVVLALTFTTPGVVWADPSLGGGASAGWLYVSRHVGPPVLIALALAPWPAGWDDGTGSSARRGRLTLLAVLTVLIVGPASIALEVMAFPDVLPRIVNPATGHFEPPAYALVLAVNLVAVAVGCYGVARRGGRSGVEVWAIVAGFAWLGDVGFVGMYEGRFTVAYYGSRLLAVLAAVIVPATILVDTWRLHQRLTVGAADLEAQVRRLLEAQRIRDHVSAVVSHDMRTPLAGLHGYLEVLVDDEGLNPELVQRMHERSLMLTRRLTLLSEDLLAATTLEHSDLVITPADLDLSQQLAECASGFPDLDLRIRCSRGVQVHADPLRLQQILSNLVRNAQIHGAEPVTVEVSSDPQTVTIRVSDAGDGVPEAFIPRLFERYSQGARATSGAGIGLSVVHDLVQAHRGTIRYDLTQPAFIVTLPVGAPVDPPPAGRVLSAPRPHATT
jgi:signal transduction histidine kinase